MTISNAQPIQFWIEGTDTFNEKIEPGIDFREFTPWFNFTDKIVAQYKGDTGYFIGVFNCADVLLYSKQFEEIESGIWNVSFVPGDEGVVEELVRFKIFQSVFNPDFSGSILPWYNSGSGQVWAFDAGTAKSFGAGVTSSKDLIQDVNIPIGTYDFRIKFTGADAFGNFNMLVWLEDAGGTNKLYLIIDGGGPQLNPMFVAAANYATGSYDITVTATTTVVYTKMIVKGSSGGSGWSVNLDIFSLDPIPVVSIARSDVYELLDDHEESKFIEYANEEEFANLFFPIDEVAFGLRVHAKFFKERFPETNESEDMSDSTVVKLSGSIKSQKYFEVEPVPPYMVKKLKLALQCNTIKIDDKLWTKEAEFDVKDLDERSAYSTAKAWLTESEDDVFTNVYGTTSLT